MFYDQNLFYKLLHFKISNGFYHNKINLKLKLYYIFLINNRLLTYLILLMY